MKDYTLSSSSIMYANGSSDGTQVKFCERGKWFKQDLRGYEGEVEYIVSCLLACSNVDNYVFYHQCTINGKPGCISNDFLRPNESFISFESLHLQYTGLSLTDKVMEYQDFQERYDYTCDFILRTCNIDVKTYLSNIFSLDALTLNDDRHFNNLGVIYDYNNNKYYEAPIFDNGAGLLSDIIKYPQWKSLEENISNVVGQPLCSKLDLQAFYAGFTLQLDYNMFIRNCLSQMKQSRAVDVMYYQLEHSRNFIQNFEKDEIEL